MNKNIQRKRKIHRRRKRRLDFTNALIIMVSKRRYANGTDKLADILRMFGVSVRNPDGTHRKFMGVLNDLSKVWRRLGNDFVSKMVISHQMVGLRNSMKFYEIMNGNSK
jgi:hypothetical protein